MYVILCDNQQLFGYRFLEEKYSNRYSHILFPATVLDSHFNYGLHIKTKDKGMQLLLNIFQ